MSKHDDGDVDSIDDGDKASSGNRNSCRSMIHTALGSASAGIVSRFVTHPLDTAKARLQDVDNNGSHNNYKGTLDVFRQTLQKNGGGIRSLYRGFGAVIVAGTPGTMLYLTSYEIIKTYLSTESNNYNSNNNNNNNNNNTSSSSFWVYLTSGMLAETIACIIYVPVDVVKERLQVTHKGIYKNEQHVIRQIINNNNINNGSNKNNVVKTMAGFYRGYGATLASFGPFSALYFVFYEKLKHWVATTTTTTTTTTSSNASSQNNHANNDISSTPPLSFHHYILCSCLAGGLASWLTSPLDMAKLRLQVQRSISSTTTSTTTTTTTTTTADTYRGMIDCLSKTYQKEGIPGLFRGAGARVLHFAPATTITMTCYETFRDFFEKHI